ncbi:MAG: AraC family transcriptional regulator [Porphyromonadaceae bacterium]|jgi:AraC-like DNA-binding protein|nr:AraC family transcriptional regulator [Porphyromonadaceae bacterium]
MRFNDFGIDFKYLLVNDRDKKFGLTVNTVGFQPIAPNTVYPSSEHPKNYYFNPNKGRILSEFQFVYISKGKGVFNSQTTKKQTIHKGQMLILFPGYWHSYHPDIESGWNEYYIGFEGPIINHLLKHGFISPANPVVDVGASEELVSLFSSAIKIAKEEKKFSQQHLAGIVMHILGMVMSLSENKNFEANEYAEVIERAKIIMLENVTNNIDIQQLAKNLGTSYSWFRKAFKEYTDYSPAQYFQELKIRKAKELLAETNIPIKEIAYNLNFSSDGYFLSFFKKRVGCTPLEYRTR